MHARPTLLLACLLARLACAQEPAGPLDAAPREWIGGLPWSQWTHATGDWALLRTRLEDVGIEFGGGYTADLAAPWSGNTRRRSSISTLFDLNVAIDLEALAGLPKTLAYVDAYQIEGRDPTSDVGDFQGLSNIQADDGAEIAEVWVETWLGESVRLKVGKVDFNSEFAFHEIGGEFVASTAAIVPTIVAYPTYPNPATSINVFVTPAEHWHVGAAIYDGAGADGIATGRRGPKGFFDDEDSDAYFLAAEIGYTWTGGQGWGAGRCVLGAFHHTATFTTFGGATENGTSGLWGSLEQRVWREHPGDAEDDQGLGTFFSFGFADDAVAVCGQAFAFGFEWRGAVPTRDHDVLGLCVCHADLSDDPGAGTPGDETAIELLYKVALTPAVSLKPEVQYILDAGGLAGADDVLVGLLRLEVLF